MNYTSFIVKILEKPQQTKFNDNTLVIKTSGEIFTLKNSHINYFIKINIWLLTNDFYDNIYVGDFLIIEGYIFFRFDNFNQKCATISVFNFNNLSILI